MSKQPDADANESSSPNKDNLLQYGINPEY